MANKETKALFQLVQLQKSHHDHDLDLTSNRDIKKLLIKLTDKKEIDLFKKNNPTNLIRSTSLPADLNKLDLVPVSNQFPSFS